MKESNKKYYFDIADIIDKYPEAIFYIAIGGRSTGKTYGGLSFCIDRDHKFIFIKRCIDDVKMLCAGSTYKKNGVKENKFAIDLSPFAPINRDRGTNIRAFSIPDVNSLGAFYPCDEGNVPCDEAVGYIAALNGVTKFKGFDLSACDWMIFDEFIAASWERVSRKEGDQLMNLYRTAARDREHRGKDPLKVMMFANAEEISNPIFNTLEITDIVADMQINNIHELYIKERGIVIVRVQSSAEFLVMESASKIYAAMEGTAWASMSLGNNFAYNDFTAVKHVDLRKYSCVCAFRHNRKEYYLYNNEAQWYVTKRRNGRLQNVDRYDLIRETDAERFYYNIIVDIRPEAIENRVLFESFSLYDLFTNYKKFYKVG